MFDEFCPSFSYVPTLPGIVQHLTKHSFRIQRLILLNLKSELKSALRIIKCSRKNNYADAKRLFDDKIICGELQRCNITSVEQLNIHSVLIIAGFAETIRSDLSKVNDLMDEIEKNPGDGSPQPKLTLKERITWLGTLKQLLAIMLFLAENHWIKPLSKDEIISHFSFTGAEAYNIDFLKFMEHVIEWLGSDADFAAFINYLADAGLILVEKNVKYKQFEPHFVNSNLQPIKDLAQKFYNLKNYSKKRRVLQDVIKEIAKEK